MESLPTDTFASSRTYEKSGIPALRWLKNIFSRLIGQGVSQSGFLAPAIAEVCRRRDIAAFETGRSSLWEVATTTLEWP